MKHFIISLFFLGFVLYGSAQSQSTVYNHKTPNLVLLNSWDNPPEPWKQEFYGIVNTIFERSPMNSFADLADDENYRRICTMQNLLLLGGPMLGNISDTGCSVWVRTSLPSEVKIVVIHNGIQKIFGPVPTTAATDLSAIVKVNGLKPGTCYPYKILVNSVEVSIPAGSSIRTTGGKSSLTRIAFGSCFHRRGLGNPNLSSVLINRNPDAMLLLGDIAVQDRNNHAGLHRADYLARDMYPAWQKIAAGIPIYATWDDHDYFDNDLSGIPAGYTHEDRKRVWQVFRYAWNNPSYGFGDTAQGVFFRTRVGCVDIIAVDNRYFRNGEKGVFLGNEQMKWLEEQLLNCKGPFIILSCGTMWSDYVTPGKDSWGIYDPEGRERIFRLIEKNNIGGVLLISGDRHGARGFKIPRNNGFCFYEFEAASLGGLSGPPVADTSWKTQLFGIAGVFAFGEFTFDTAPADPTVTFRLIKEDASVIYELTLPRSKLMPDNKQ